MTNNFKKKIYLYYFYLSVCVLTRESGFVHVGAVLQRPEECTGPHGTGVKGGCELLEARTGNRIWVLWKGKKFC